MAKGNDDLDLIGLFGLSTEEAAGLGLDSPAARARLDVREPATPVSEVQSLRSPGWVRNAESRPIVRTGVDAGADANGRTAGAGDTDVAPALPDPFDDDRAFLDMLTGEDAAAGGPGGRDGFDGCDGFEESALPTRAATAPTVTIDGGVDPTERGADAGGTDDGNDRFMPAATAAAERQTPRIRTDEVLPAAAIDGAGGIDGDIAGAGDIGLAALFGLSTEEATVLGLALPPNALEMGGASAGGHDERDTPAPLANAMPTMPPRAITMPEHGLDEGTPGGPGQGATPDDTDTAPGPAESRQRAAPAHAERDRAPADTIESPVVSALTLQGPSSALFPQGQATAGHDTITPIDPGSVHRPGGVGVSPVPSWTGNGRDAHAPNETDDFSRTLELDRGSAGHDANEDAEDIDPLLLEAFAEESAELLDGLHVELERLERDPGDQGALLEIRRVVHTIKGGAKMCRFEHVVTLTHACENLLDLAADDAESLGAPGLRALFACEPLLRALVHAALSGHDDGTAVDAAIKLAIHFDALCTGVDGGARDGNNDTDIVAATTVPSDIAPLAPSVPDHGDAKDGIPLHGVGDGAPADNQLNSARATGTERPPAVEHEERLRPQAPPAATPAMRAAPGGAATAPGGERGAAPERGGRRGRESINVDLSKVDAVVAKVTEMAAHRSSYQGMVGQLMETTGEARGNILRLRQLALSIGNECATAQPALPAATTAAPPVRRQEAGDLDLESYNTLATLALQLQEAVADQQALIEKMYDTITNHWSLRATENRVDADLHSALMNIRLIPLTSMRVRLDGVVRQAAQTTGKSVRWQLHGGTVAVEKNVFDRLFEPLMHLLRNAVDHGLEAPEARGAAGKPAMGVITVTAKQQDNHVVITVADDGAGIVPATIAAVAVERGVIAAEAAAALSARQQMEMIFTPGFSTAASVSHLSGRGVGMDAVREACLRMGGSIAVDSREDVGTTFTMRLPLSLSVTRGLIVRDGGSYMAVPVGQISALHLVPAADIVNAPGAPGSRVARIDGHDLPIYNLPQPSGFAPAAYVQHGEVHVLQVPHEGGSIGLIIEDVLDEEEILIKAAPPLLRGVKTLLGSYVLPDGAVAPVVNLPQLLADLRPTVTLHEEREEQAARGPVALVVDDSMSMRVALSGTLQGAGFTVLTARDGQEALEALKREGLPSIITLDIEMPRMDGLETLFAIRQMPGAGDLPIFMMTSRGGTKHRRAAEQLGATHYFTKPYRDAELANAARAACALGA